MFGGDEAKGNFFPVVLDSSYKDKPITVKRTSGTPSEKTVNDTEWLLRLTDGTATKYEFSNEGMKIFDLTFTGATLSTKPEMEVGTDPLTEDNVPKDKNAEAAKKNQKAISVKQVGDNYEVSAKLADMQEYESTDPSQSGQHKWFALIIDTGEDDIKKVKVNGQQLTEQDVKDATSVGAKAGSFVLWLEADTIKDAPVVLTLSVDGKADRKIKITLTEDAVG